MKKKPIYTIMYMGQHGIACQPIKAIDESEAKTKFLKKYSKKTEESIIECSLLDEDHKHYHTLASHAI